jgi:hypothetical protein
LVRLSLISESAFARLSVAIVSGLDTTTGFGLIAVDNNSFMFPESYFGESIGLVFGIKHTHPAPQPLTAINITSNNISGLFFCSSLLHRRPSKNQALRLPFPLPGGKQRADSSTCAGCGIAPGCISSVTVGFNGACLGRDNSTRL